MIFDSRRLAPARGAALAFMRIARRHALPASPGLPRVTPEVVGRPRVLTGSIPVPRTSVNAGKRRFLRLGCGRVT